MHINIVDAHHRILVMHQIYDNSIGDKLTLLIWQSASLMMSTDGEKVVKLTAV